MLNSCLHKQGKVKSLFGSCVTADQKYQILMELGKGMPLYPDALKTKEYLVSGCQSITYLYGSVHNGVMHFSAYSEAFISAGLAALLIEVYGLEPPEAILKCPPDFLQDLQLGSLLSPGRSQGLASLFYRMQQLAVQAITDGMTRQPDAS